MGILYYGDVDSCHFYSDDLTQNIQLIKNNNKATETSEDGEILLNIENMC